MATYKLSTRTPSGTGGPSLLRASNSITAGAAGVGSFRPQMLNVNAANQTSTPQPVVKINPDTSLDAAAVAATQITRSAFEYQDRKEAAEATELMLAYKNSTRSMYRGEVGADGKMQGGYANTELNEAVTGFQGYSDGLDASYAQLLDGVSESVKARVIPGMLEIKNRALDKGVDHNGQQFKLYEQDLQFKKQNSIVQDISDNGVGAWTDGTIPQFVGEIKDEKTRIATLDSLAKQTLQIAYNQAVEKANDDPSDLAPSIAGFRAVEDSYKTMENQLPGVVKNSALHMVNQLEASSIKAAKIDAREKKDRRLTSIANLAPEKFAQTIQAGNYDILGVEVAGLRGQYENEATGSKVVMNALQQAMATSVYNTPGSYNVKKATAESIIRQIDADTSLSQYERMALEQYANDTLPAQIRSRFNRTDHDDIANAANFYDGVISKERMPEKLPMPPNMLPENQAKWDQAYKLRIDGQTTGPDGSTQAERKQRAQFYAFKLDDGLPLTNTQLDHLSVMRGMGEIEKSDFDNIMQKQNDIKAGKYTPEGFKNSEQYKLGKKFISLSGFFLMDDDTLTDAEREANLKPEQSDFDDDYDGIRDYNMAMVNWGIRMESRQMHATKSLNDAARAQGDKFSFKEWSTQYAMDNMNTGNFTRSVIPTVQQHAKAGVAAGLEQSVHGVFTEARDQGNFLMNVQH